MRLGFNGEWRWWRLARGLDLAWIPWAWLNANDTHWLRPLQRAPESGNSFYNVQIEALLGYQFLMAFRWLSADDIGGLIPRCVRAFESGLGGLPQTISLNSQRWGGFLQASYKFGELRPTRY